MKITKNFSRSYFKRHTGLRARTHKNPTSLYSDLVGLVKLGWGNACLLLVNAPNSPKDPQSGTADLVKLKDVSTAHLKSVLSRLEFGEDGRFNALLWLYFDNVNTFCLRPSAVVTYESPQDFFAWVCEASLALPRGAALTTPKGYKYLSNVTLADCETWAKEGAEIIV